ncbi:MULTISPECIES: TetR/AcrR family transcriptional regulator [Clostridium]|uniref:TetR/AcrR family transcriptional regulator n=1 Tax=Clostridium TaxID=1485 RepID=UPI0008258E7E|nr:MULTISPECIES: TetR/AcrR family transcriptional regulator [Clostridium]PJI07448.1 TetR/AcrR family transcriptional regulator [Clostridium sp. CT7]
MEKNYDEKPKQKRAFETRKKLIIAAEELFNKKGFYDTTSKDIAKEAGVSIGIFYNYFKDKSRIYYECLNLGYDDDSSKIIELLKGLFDEDEDLKTKIYNYLYDGLLKIRSKIKIVMERDRIMTDYPEIKKLIKIRDEEIIKEVANYFSSKDSEVIAKLIVETTSRNAVVVFSMEDSKKQEKYMEYLAEMLSCFLEKFKK